MNKSFSSASICWDAHGCPPFKIGADLSFLKRYKDAGINFVSLNIGFDLSSQVEAINLVNYFRLWIKNNAKNYEIIENVNQLEECKIKNKLGIAFDIEGCNLLNGSLEMVETFYLFGVRQMIFVYNNNNIAGGGCFDHDTGLTTFGKELVVKCNDVGMIIDCSHVGYKSSMEIIELSQYPVIFSHSNSASLRNHPRNITDEQIIACAKNNGVIGINGIGVFLGNNDTRTERIVDHIDYIAQLVGCEHVGIGLDCVFEPDEIEGFIKNNPDTFPAEFGFNDVAIAEPEQFSEIGNLLLSRGYSGNDIANILGENFLRVAKNVWR